MGKGSARSRRVQATTAHLSALVNKAGGLLNQNRALPTFKVYKKLNGFNGG